MLTAIEEVEQKLVHMACELDEALLSTMVALVSKDVSLVKKIVSKHTQIDIQIDNFQKDLKHFCKQAVFTQQLPAADVRYLTTSIKVATALKKCGDFVSHICQNIDVISKFYLQKYTYVLQEMVYIISRMNKSAIDSFVSGDVELVQDTAGMYKEIIKQTDNLELTENPKVSTAFINIIHCLEKIAKVLVDISEYTITPLRESHVNHN